jgi:hypothetical protein
LRYYFLGKEARKSTLLVKEAFVRREELLLAKRRAETLERLQKPLKLGKYARTLYNSLK